MRALLLILAILFQAPPVVADGKVASNGDDWIRRTNAPCTHEAILAQIHPVLREQYMAGVGMADGKRYEVCWFSTPRGVHVRWEDGDQSIIDERHFVWPPNA